MAPIIRRLFSRAPHYIEEVLLAGIILLNVTAFFELLTPDWDYIKKVLSWTILGYLLYKIQITKILFGNENKQMDLAIVLSYFVLSFKIVLGYAVSMLASLKEKGFSYWAVLRPAETGSVLGSPDMGSSVIGLSSTIDNVNISALPAVQLAPEANRLVDTLGITNIFPLQINEVYLNISNNMSSGMFLLDTRFFIHRWLNLMSQNIELMTNISLVMGFIMLVVVAWNLTVRLDVHHKSLMGVIHEEGKAPSTPLKALERFVIILLVLLFFYVSIINLFLEWLAFSIDAPIMMLGLFTYLLFIIKHFRRFHPDKALFKLGSFGEDLYNKVLSLFHTKEGIYLGIAGMLSLHLLTDFGIFIIPYLTGRFNPFYFSQIGSAENYLISPGGGVLYGDIAISTGILEKLSVTAIHIGNIVAISMLLVLPAYMLYRHLKSRRMNVGRRFLALFFSSVFCLMSAPAFSLGRTESSMLQGVEISVGSVYRNTSVPINILLVTALAVFAGVYALSKEHRIKERLTQLMMLALMMFFLIYTYYFFSDMIGYYLAIIPVNIVHGNYFISLIMLTFFSLTIIFYCLGAVFIVINTHRILFKNSQGQSHKSG